ncbi:MAG TPA: V-type ATP synthase subunit A [Clostridiales bacterium]|nr:V-type ATP synthase subunit A [Clostridiales bacterium]
MNIKKGRISMVNGPVIKGTGMKGFQMREMVLAGPRRLIGEVVSIEGESATIQVYEESEGLKAGQDILSTGKPLSLKLGPGIIGNIFDGIQRPLKSIHEMSPGFLPAGIGLISLDEEREWETKLTVSEGQYLTQGQVFGEVQETASILHKLMVPPGIEGKVEYTAPDGSYNISQVLVRLRKPDGELHELKMVQEWPVRIPRPVKERQPLQKPLITGQRILDMFFPIAKGGTAAIPGGFGTGKTMLQHQLAKWSDADIIIYVGCGERGNEMTEVLEDFPKLIDPRTKRSLMERTVLIANTSNMPVAAREASIYTGITLAEYYRDMGYHVAIMADSTSRWAEALREISGRLEEMPAEEGYPAYLPSRLAGFYERAGAVETLSGQEGSITIIGAVSPPGGDFSEPVTQNTKRFVGAFLALDRSLAYARHFPAVSWLSSYTGYIDHLADWYSDNVAHDAFAIRTRMLKLLHEETKLMEIVKLVGEDVLPDDQRWILEVARLIKNGFMSQNAYHNEDAYVPLSKQYRMISIIDYLYHRGMQAVKKGIPVSVVRNGELFEKLFRMKYNIPNDRLELFDGLERDIDSFYDNLENKYSDDFEKVKQ